MPIIDTIISHDLLSKPRLSLRMPRYGDPAQRTGQLVIGGIEDTIDNSDMAYGDIVPFSR